MMATRRGVLIGFAAGSAVIATNDISAPQSTGRLNRIEDLVKLLTIEMSAQHGGEWRYVVDHSAAFVLVSPIE
ncbi:hypothetical protein [Pseudochrobactrum lubricantis]|uniref:hypothetical protein n=1 Tax=Pseudochrobactrum lubricantis TaxID=558172 RepID=UPI0035DF998B